jgi:predicted nuclease of predicted toxin-antitoxin system
VRKPTILIDQNLPRRATQVFEQFGLNAIHVSSVRLSGRPDQEIWRYAAMNDMVIVTKDLDFSQIYDLALKKPVRVVILRVGNTTNSTLFPWLSANWQRAQLRLDQGHTLVELR